MILFCLGWFAIALFAFVHGDPVQLILPSNSDGEICGRSRTQLADKPSLLFFDLTHCVKISAVAGGCATPQVCVTKCPDRYWTWTSGKDAFLKNFCTDLSPGEFEARTIKDLVMKRKCPAFLIPSRPFLGRCVPTFGLVGVPSKDEATATKANITGLRTSSEGIVDVKDLKKGMEYLMTAINLQGKNIRRLLSFSANVL